MDAAELDRLIDAASALAKERNASAARSFGLGNHARYDLDLATQRLVFTDAAGVPKVTARVVAVGSLAPDAGTWLWSWDNRSIPPAASAAMAKLRDFGEREELPALTGAFSPCDEALAWALAALSLQLLDAEAVYRVESSGTLLFMLLFDVSKA